MVFDSPAVASGCTSCCVTLDYPAFIGSEENCSPECSNNFVSLNGSFHCLLRLLFYFIAFSQVINRYTSGVSFVMAPLHRVLPVVCVSSVRLEGQTIHVLALVRQSPFIGAVILLWLC